MQQRPVVLPPSIHLHDHHDAIDFLGVAKPVFHQDLMARLNQGTEFNAGRFHLSQSELSELSEDGLLTVAVGAAAVFRILLRSATSVACQEHEKETPVSCNREPAVACRARRFVRTQVKAKLTAAATAARQLDQKCHAGTNLCALLDVEDETQFARGVFCASNFFTGTAVPVRFADRVLKWRRIEISRSNIESALESGVYSVQSQVYCVTRCDFERKGKDNVSHLVLSVVYFFWTRNGLALEFFSILCGRAV